MAKKRVNIFIPEHIHAWFQKRSEEVGVSMSGLMCLALEEHMVQRESISGLNLLNELIIKEGEKEE